MLAPLLAALVAGSPAAPLADSGPVHDEFPGEEAGEPPRLRLHAWGGTLYDIDDEDGIPFAGGEVAWAFGSFDVGLLAAAYRFGEERADDEWGPVILGRIERRFETRPGLEATIAFGAGAAREDGWTPWFQVAFGFRATRGPVFFGGELGLEADQLLRLGATVGVALF